MLGYLWILAEADVANSTGLGSYTAFASLGVVGIIGLLCLYMVMHTMPTERKAERDALQRVSTNHDTTVERICKNHDVSLDALSKTLHDAVRETGVMFVTTLREYREEQARRDTAERESRDAMLRSSDAKVDHLSNSFQDLALSLSDVMQAMSLPNHSGTLRRRRDQRNSKDKESVLE